MMMILLLMPVLSWCQERTELSLAIQRGGVCRVEKLLEDGTSVEKCYVKEQSCLGHAISYGMCFLTRVLLKHHTDPNVLDLNGDPAIFSAVRYKRMEGLQLLIEYGANVYARNSQGDTLLRTAVNVRSAELVRWFLVQYGMDPYEKSPFDGKSPIDIARKNGYNELVDLMTSYTAYTTLSYGASDPFSSWAPDEFSTDCLGHVHGHLQSSFINALHFDPYASEDSLPLYDP